MQFDLKYLSVPEDRTQVSVLNFQTSSLMPKPKASELGRRKNVATLSELHGLVITVTGLSSVTMAFNSTHKTEKIKSQ